MAETQVTGRQIKDKSVFDIDIDLTTAAVHPILVGSDRLVIVDPTDGNVKTSTISNLLQAFSNSFLYLPGVAGGQRAIGGTAISDTLKLQGTSGNGTLSSPAIQMLVGNNGATIANTLLNNGNLGLGIINPSQRLDLGGGNIQMGAGKIMFGGYTDRYLADAYGFSLVGTLTRPIQVRSAALLVGYNAAGASYPVGNLLVSGNVGINVLAPSARLEIRSNTGQLRLSYSDTAYYQISVDSAGSINFESSGSGGFSVNSSNNYLILNSTGISAFGDYYSDGNQTYLSVDDGQQIVRINALAVGINTASPEGALHILQGYSTILDTSGHILLEETVSGNRTLIGVTADDGQFVIKDVTNARYNLYVDRVTGFVGINTDHPQAELDVGGSIASNDQVNTSGGVIMLTKERGASLSLRGYNFGPTYCGLGENIGWVEMDAFNGVYGYSDVAAITAVAAEQHDDKSKGTQLDFWVTPTGAGQTNLLAMTLTPAGKVKGLNGFAVFGADGMSGTAVVVTGVSYNSATKTLTFSRSIVTFNGGIATAVTGTANTVIAL